MTSGYLCDVCETFDKNEHRKTRVEWENVNTLDGGHTTFADTDLCPDCAHELAEFLEMFDEENRDELLADGGERYSEIEFTDCVDGNGPLRDVEDADDDLRTDGGRPGVNNGQLLQHFEEGQVVTYVTDPACCPDQDVPTTRHTNVEVWVYDGWVVLDSGLGGETTVYPRQRVKEVFAR